MRMSFMMKERRSALSLNIQIESDCHKKLFFLFRSSTSQYSLMIRDLIKLKGKQFGRFFSAFIILTWNFIRHEFATTEYAKKLTRHSEDWVIIDIDFL